MMKNIKTFVENIVHERNDIIEVLAKREKVDLTNSNWDSFKPKESFQNDALEELTELAVYFEDEYKSLRLPEILQYCKEKHKFNENWSGILKSDVLRLLGLDSNTDINILFNGLE